MDVRSQPYSQHVPHLNREGPSSRSAGAGVYLRVERQPAGWSPHREGFPLDEMAPWTMAGCGLVRVFSRLSISYWRWPGKDGCVEVRRE
jgi:hypothetical protein